MQCPCKRHMTRPCVHMEQVAIFRLLQWWQVSFKGKGTAIRDGGIDGEDGTMVAGSIACDGDGRHPCGEHGGCGELEVGPEKEVLAIIVIDKPTQLVAIVGRVHCLDKHMQRPSHILWAM